MPLRRSCFLLEGLLDLPEEFRFNATTAFLLPGVVVLDVDPRHGFNATTAFLLRLSPKDIRLAELRFNATTAFLLPSSPRWPTRGRW